MQKNFIIVTTFNRESIVDVAETLEQAQQMMKEQFDEYCNDHNIDLEFDSFSIDETSAWVNTDDDYDISIHNISQV